MDLVKFASEPEPSLAHSFKTLWALKAVLSSCQALERHPQWIREAKLACDRLELALDIKGRQRLKELAHKSKVADALEYVQSEQILATPGFQKAVDVLKQAKMFEDLSSQFDPKTPHDTIQCVKVMLTLCTLDIECIRFFYPDMVEKVNDYTGKVEKHMEEQFGKIEAGIKDGRAQVKSYRLG